MPVVEDEKGEVIFDPTKPVKMPVPPAPPPKQFGPNVAGPPTFQTGAPNVPDPMFSGLRGRARFENEVNRRTFTGGFFGEEFNQWVLTLPEDPLDPEYNEVLRWARDQARARLAEATRKRLARERATANSGLGYAFSPDPTEGTRIRAPGPPEKTTPEKKEPYQFEGDRPIPREARYMVERDKFVLPGGVGDLPKETKPGVPFPNQATGPKTQSEQAKEMAQLEAEKEPGKRKLAAIEWGKPVFRGAPIDEGDYITPTVGAGMTGDTELNKFLSQEGIHLEPTRASTALQSGDYVYMGQEHNATLGVSRDSYLYVGNAMAAGADQRVLPREVIAKYQQELGLPVSGYLDDTLTKIWEYSVKLAAYYAQSNPDNKVTPRELFDLHVQGEIAKHKAGGGGGGGGGAEPLVAFDYYRAMMQILGDISGVGEAA